MTDCMCFLNWFIHIHKYICNKRNFDDCILVKFKNYTEKLSSKIHKQDAFTFTQESIRLPGCMLGCVRTWANSAVCELDCLCLRYSASFKLLDYNR